MKVWGLALLLLVACTSKHSPVETVKFEVTEVAQEVQIPKAVMNEVDEEVKKDGAAVAPVYLFVPIQIQFTELSEDVLKNPAFSYVFPKGGGLLDLKDVVVGEGSFYMNFGLQPYFLFRLFILSSLWVFCLSNQLHLF